MQRHQRAHLLAVNSPDDGLLYLLMGLIRHYTEFVLESWQGKV